MSAPAETGRRPRLWVILAVLVAASVAAMHAAHLVIGNRIGSRAVTQTQLNLGHNIGRIIADRAADPLLVNDVVTLHELVTGAVERKPGGVVYCLIVRDGKVIASSYGGRTPLSLVAARSPGDPEPLLLEDGDTHILDVVEPILEGLLGEVRVGLDKTVARQARRQMAVELGLTALALILLGVVAALWAARFIARPVSEILDAADRFDPAAPGQPAQLAPHGSREIAVLGERFNRMMVRLRAAHAEQAAARRRAVETERMVALGALVAGVAHEVNNPLAGLKNCVRRLERGDLPEHKRGEYLELMDEGLSRIEEVVRRLLDFGRPQPPSLAPVPAARLAEEGIAFVRAVLDRRRVRVRVIDEAEDGGVLADRRMIGQALVNLLLNAFHVTPDGAEIRIRLRRRRGAVGLTVEDDGPGIPPELRDRILDPFFTTKDEGQGTGLGLSVTRTLVDAHKGELAFDFPPEGGTHVTVWLHDAAAPLVVAG